MAKLQTNDTIDFPREEVFTTFRDELLEFVDDLADIEAIEVKSRERVDDNTVEIVNLWEARDTEVPTMARKFIKPEMLQWHDYATWKQDEWVCEWRMEVGFLEDAIDCTGETRYLENGDQSTRIQIRGDLDVDASQIPGVPSLVAGKVGDAVENFVVKLIEPNLSDVNRGLEKYLESKTE